MNGKTVREFIFVGNSNFCTICHNVRDIRSRNVRDIDLDLDLDHDLQNGPMTNINMPIERPYATFDLLEFVCPICHRLRNIDGGNLRNLDLDLQNRPRSNVNMPMEKPDATLCLLVIAMFALSVTIPAIRSRNAQDLGPDLWSGPKSNVNMPIERPHVTFCVDNSNVCPICHSLRLNHE